MSTIQFTKRDLLIAVLMLEIVFGIYWLSARVNGQTQTPPTSYFDALAAALLRGKLFLENPIATNDLTLYQGKWYVPFLPLPAFLMLPWVATVGTVNTVLFSAFCGAANVSLVFLIIRSMIIRQWVRINYIDSVWLATFFGLGSVHWYMSKVGSVWFVSQICTVTFMALSVLFAIRFRQPFLAGLALGVAMWARPHVILMYPLLAGIGYKEYQEMLPQVGRGFLIRWVSRSIIPNFISMLGILLYNWLRFNNLFDFGYLTENVTAILRDDLAMYGQFNLHFVVRNVRAMLFALPYWDGQRFIPDVWGMSILITSPALFFLAKARQRSPLVIGAWLSIFLILIPLLTYYNTGFFQFGYRFSLDFMIPMMVLLPFASQDKMPILMKILITLGVLINLWGLQWCCVG